MNIFRTFIANFAHPKGLLGRLVAWRLDISNKEANEWTLSLLDIRPADHLLEVGFGSGRTLKTAAKKLSGGYAAGVDSSLTMLKLARKINARFITCGLMELKLGDIEELPYGDNSFDKVYAVQVINYLANPIKGLKELHRVTKPGGRVALFFEAKEKFNNIQILIEGIYRPYDGDEVIGMLRDAGFSHSMLESKHFSARGIEFTGYVAIGEKEVHGIPLNLDPIIGNNYLIEVKEPLQADWSDWFDGLTISSLGNGSTMLSGRIVDQAALHGILAKIRDMNLTLISVKQ